MLNYIDHITAVLWQHLLQLRGITALLHSCLTHSSGKLGLMTLPLTASSKIRLLFNLVQRALHYVCFLHNKSLPKLLSPITLVLKKETTEKTSEHPACQFILGAQQETSRTMSQSHPPTRTNTISDRSRYCHIKIPLCTLDVYFTHR